MSANDRLLSEAARALDSADITLAAMKLRANLVTKLQNDLTNALDALRVVDPNSDSFRVATDRVRRRIDALSSNILSLS